MTALTEAGSSAGTAPAPRQPPRILRRVFTFLLAWLTIPWLIVSFFMVGVMPGGWATLAGILVLALGAAGLRTRGFATRSYASAIMRSLVFVPFYYFFLFLPLLAIGAILGALVAWPFAGPVTGGRAAIEGLTALLGLLVVAGYAGSKRLVVRQVDFRHPMVPPEFDGLRIVQLSDLHVGPHTSSGFLMRILEAVERARPDIIAFTGDQVDDYAEDAAQFVELFGRLRAPLGLYAIAGNHDIYAGWKRVAATLRGAGIHVMENEGLSLRRGRGTLWIGGTGDPAARQFAGNSEGQEPVFRGGPIPDLDRTMADAPADAFRLVLAHNPALWDGLAERGAHLTLSGHTHHGQFSIPTLNWSVASPFVKYAMGRHTSGDATLYISPGTNFWGIPFRLGAWPEVTVVTLRTAA